LELDIDLDLDLDIDIEFGFVLTKRNKSQDVEMEARNHCGRHRDDRANVRLNSPERWLGCCRTTEFCRAGHTVWRNVADGGGFCRWHGVCLSHEWRM